MADPKMIEGINFSSLDEVRKLLNLQSPVVKALHEANVGFLKAYMAAEEKVLLMFCERLGIVLPDLTSLRLRIAMMPKVELVTATMEAPGTDRTQPFVVQETWCVDRRNGYEGFERTWPRVQMVNDGKMTITVGIVDDPDTGKAEGT